MTHPPAPADRLRLDGRVVAVAGAGGGGIGTTTCTYVAASGATVIGLDTSVEGRATATERLAAVDARFEVLDVDVSVAADVQDALLDIEARHGPVDGLVNVVGGMRERHWGALVDMPDETLDDLLRANLMAPVAASRAVAARLLHHELPGAIVHVASVAGLTGLPYGALYGAAKAAVVNLAQSMAVEWGRGGIRVNAVAPGTVVTPKLGRERFDGADDGADGRADDENVPLRRRGTPDDVAGVVTFLLSDLAAYVTGHTLVVDGGMLARPAFTDATDLPVFVSDSSLRARLWGAGR